MKKYLHVKNPLTIIGIFAGVSETAGNVILPFLLPDNQVVYMWFLIIFPSSLVLLFFATLNFNNKVLYAPSDFQNDKSWLFINAVTKKPEPQKAEEGIVSGLDPNEDVKKVLRALDRYSWRTVGGLAGEAGMKEADVIKSLNWLSSYGLVIMQGERTGSNQKWVLTYEGNQTLKTLKRMNWL